MSISRGFSAVVTGFSLFIIAGCGAERHSGMSSRTEEQDAIIVMNGDDPAFFWRSATQQALRPG
jgi:hypothetical protein